MIVVANNLSPQSQMWVRDIEKRLKDVSQELSKLSTLISSSNSRAGSSLYSRQLIDGQHYLGHFLTMDELWSARPAPDLGDFATVGTTGLMATWYFDGSRWYRDIVSSGSSVSVGSFAGSDPYQMVTSNGISIGNLANGHAVEQGTDNISIGSLAGQNSVGLDAIALGSNAGASSENLRGIFIGSLSGTQAKNADGASVALGHLSAYQSENMRGIAIGEYSAMNSQGFEGVAFGPFSASQSTNFRGIAIGQNSAQNANNPDSSNITLLGRYSGQGSQNSHDIIAIGGGAASYLDGSSEIIAIGSGAAAYGSGLTGNEYVVAIGYQTVHLGATSSLGPVTNTVAVGRESQFLASSDAATLGAYAGNYAGDTTLLTAVGRSAAQYAVGQEHTTAIGSYALYSAGETVNATVLGANAGYNDGTTYTANGLHHITLLGANAQATVDNVFVMGSAVSDERATACLGNYDKLGSDVQGGVAVADAVTAPTVTPTGGGILYVEAGALKYVGSAGTVTTLGVA